jgi:energy-coupling factor transport system ATP-binding protein
METIRFDNVTFAYPLAERNALEGVNLTIRQSEFVILCGKSGCGKTTLLKHLKKNLIPYGTFSGSVTYEGCEVAELPDKAERRLDRLCAAESGQPAGHRQGLA